MGASATRSLRTAVEDHLGSHDVSRVIYGSIVGLALVVALEHHPPGAGATAAAVVGAAVAVGLAEVYSDAVGEEARLRRRVTLAQLRTFAGDAGAVTFGAAFPAAFFVLAGLGAIELPTAFTLAKWSGLGLICGYGLLAARLAGAGWRRSILQAAAVGAVGGALIVLKALVH
jgi:hypothetical protein